MKTVLIIGVCILCNLSFAGNKHLTGNAGWDLLSAKSDSIPTEQNSFSDLPQKKNPFMNGLYSLVIPGAGQLNTERYTKAAIFFTVEAALITFAVIKQKAGDKKTQDFQIFADQHWSAVRYAHYIETYGVSDYGPNIDGAFNYTAIASHDFSQIRAWEQGQHSEGFSHQMPDYGSQQYYELIGKYNQYKFGWDTYPQDANGVPISDNGNYDSMIPQQMLNYAKERGKANDYYYAAGTAMAGLVINHILSAMDGYLSARSYNNELTSTVGMRMQNIGGENTLISELQLQVAF